MFCNENRGNCNTRLIMDTLTKLSKHEQAEFMVPCTTMKNILNFYPVIYRNQQQMVQCT